MKTENEIKRRMQTLMAATKGHSDYIDALRWVLS